LGFADDFGGATFFVVVSVQANYIRLISYKVQDIKQMLNHGQVDSPHFGLKLRELWQDVPQQASRAGAGLRCVGELPERD
jgi:hypothetical protein